LQNIAKGNRAPAGEGKAEANGPAYLEHLRQSFENRREWLKKPTFITDPNITPGERTRLYERYLQLTQDPNGALDARMSEAQTMARRFLGDKFKGDSGRFQDAYMAAVSRRQNELGTRVSDEEKQDIARALAMEVVRRGPDGREAEGRVFEVVGSRGAKAEVNIWKVYDSIPEPRRNQIINHLRGEKRPHSPKAVVEFYLQNAR
jgi:hypothetical protein